ncbi:MAG: hypothetical protein K6E36_11535 [Oscillospiraceae bacterium]|nr:hypothetical protein [Oscillospiraceae bacterium]
MEQKNLYDALTGIREDYLTRSEDYSGVSAEWKRARNLKIRTAAVLCCLTLTGAAAFALYRTGKPARTLPAGTDSAVHPETGSTSLFAAEQTDVQTAQNGTEEIPAVTALTTGDAETGHGGQAGAVSGGTASAVQTGQNGQTVPTAPTDEQPALTQKPETQKQPASGLHYQCFPSTVQPDPDKDAYAEEQYPRVVLYVDGRQYRQADAEEPENLADFAAFPVSGPVPASAQGRFLGTVTELTETEQPAKAPCSQEPTLAGAEVYEYAPAGSRAALLVRKGDRCSIFLYHGYLIGNGFADAFRFYNSEITAVEYTVNVPADGARMRKAEEGSVTDPERIGRIAEVLKSLTVQGPLPKGIGTPQWEVEAREAYRVNPAGKQREDISLVIRFANGTVMRNMEFQPYIGNGYFSGMEQMTAAQCRTLRALLTP